MAVHFRVEVAMARSALVLTVYAEGKGTRSGLKPRIFVALDFRVRARAQEQPQGLARFGSAEAGTKASAWGGVG